MKIAILSDLHVGDASRAKDFQVGGLLPSEKESYQFNFREFVEKSDVQADYLIVAGDITNRADYKEFQLASEIIANIADTLGVDQKNVCYTPGNHDRNWSLITASDGASLEEQSSAPYRPMLDSDNIFAAENDAKSGSFSTEPYLCHWTYDDLVVISYNSAILDMPNDQPHFGQISEDTILSIDSILGDIDHEGKTKIFLTHHHPYQYNEPLSEYYPDFSIMQNSGALLDCLWRNRFDFVIHGHKHFPKFEVVSNELAWPLVLICSGTFSATIDSSLNNVVNNQFHLVEVVEPALDNDACKGILSSWQYLFNWGWKESTESAGISHKLAFGNYTDEKNLIELLKALISEKLADIDYIKWNSLEDDYPSIRYLPKKRLEFHLEALGLECGFELMKSSDDGLVLLKVHDNEQ